MRRRALLATIAGGTAGLAGCSSLGSTSSPETVTPTAQIPECTETPLGMWTRLVPPSTSTNADTEPSDPLQNATERVDTGLRGFHELRGAIYNRETYDGSNTERLLADAGESDSTASSEQTEETVRFLRHVSASLSAMATATEHLHRQATLDAGRDVSKLREAISFIEAAESAIKEGRSEAQQARTVAETIRTPEEDGDSTRKTNVRLAYLNRIVSGYEWYVQAEISHYEGLVSNLELNERQQNGDTEGAREKADEAVNHFIDSKNAYCTGIGEVSRYTGQWFARMVCESDRLARYCSHLERSFAYELDGNRERAREMAERAMEIADEEC